MVNPLIEDQIPYKKEMRDVFKNRVKSGVIPSTSYMAYVHYGILIQNQEIVLQLINLGFD